MKNSTKSKAGNAQKFREIIRLFQNFGTKEWVKGASVPRGKDYCILRAFKSNGLDIRLYFSAVKKIRLCVYSGGKDSTKDGETLRKINMHPSTGAEFENGGEYVKGGTQSYNLCYLVRYIDWSSIKPNDYVTLFADYAWLVAELHRIGAV